MKTIGLVGGVASGKSLVGRMLVELGAGLLDADRTGHAVLAEDNDIRDAVRDRWGEAILSQDGTINRAALAKHVFADTAAGAVDRKFLEDLLHPRIGERLSKLRDQFAAEGKPAVVLDAPLLLEAGWGSLCDIILMIDVPRELRLERAKSRGWTEAEFNRREAAQWPAEEKRRHANYFISNTGTEAELRTAVRNLWPQCLSPVSPTP